MNLYKLPKCKIVTNCHKIWISSKTICFFIFLKYFLHKDRISKDCVTLTANQIHTFSNIFQLMTSKDSAGLTLNQKNVFKLFLFFKYFSNKVLHRDGHIYLIPNNSPQCLYHMKNNKQYNHNQ